MLTPRDVDLDAWKNDAAFHPADTPLKQLGHELVRRAVVGLGELLHWLLPAGRAKSLVYTHLELVRLYANMALASGGGPALLYGDEVYTEAAVAAALRDYEGVSIPEDPRIAQYKDSQLSGGFEHAVLDGPPSGLLGAVRQEAAEPAIPGEMPTAPEHEFEWTFEDGDGLLKVRAAKGVVSIVTVLNSSPEYARREGADPQPWADREGDVGWHIGMTKPFDVSQFLSAVAAAGERAFTN